MARLTNAIRDEIKHRAMKFATDSKTAELQKRRKELGDRWYATVVGPHLEAMQKMPMDWFSTEDKIDFYIEGCYRNLFFSESKLIPYRFTRSKGLMVNNTWDFAGEFNAIEAEAESFKRTKEKLEKEISVVLNTSTTIEKLRVTWPECEPFIVGLTAREVYLPMIQVSSINDVIAALKAEEAELEEAA